MTILPLLSDLLLLTATLGLTAFCWVLSGRKPPAAEPDPVLVDRLTALETEFERLSVKAASVPPPAPPEPVDPELDRRLQDAIMAADDRIGRLELLMAGLDDMEFDLNDPAEPDAARPPVFQPLRGARMPGALS
jgi:hypothetical protein